MFTPQGGGKRDEAEAFEILTLPPSPFSPPELYPLRVSGRVSPKVLKTLERGYQMKKFLFSFLIGAFLLGLGISTWGAEAPAKKLKIGLIGSYTGPLASMGVVTRNGSLLAQKHINEDGGFVVAGQRYLLDLIECDDRTDPKVAVSCATRLMDEHDIKIMIGPMLSASTLAVQPIAQPRKVIQINYSSAKEIIRPGITYTINGTTNAEFRSKFLPPFYVKEMGIKTVAFIVENMATARSMHEYQAPAFEALGCKVVGKETFEMGETDFFTPLTRLKTKNPDALFLATNPGSGALVVKQRLEIGWPVQTIGESNNPTAEFFRIAGAAVEGHVDMGYLSPWANLTPELIELLRLDPKKRERFNREYLKEYGEKARTGGVDDYGYDFVYVAVEAMKKAGTVTDTDKIMQAVKAFEYRGVLWGVKVSPLGREENRGFIYLLHPSDKPDKLDMLAVWWSTNMDEMKYAMKIIKKPPRIEEVRKQRGY
jgi:branched-chain amino acid transport system substrate-binding protein